MSIKKILSSAVFLYCLTSLSFAAQIHVKLDNNSKEDYVINMEPSFACLKKVSGDAQAGYNRISPKSSKSIVFENKTCGRSVTLFLSLEGTVAAKINCYNKNKCDAWYSRISDSSYILKEDSHSSPKALHFLVDKRN